MTINILEDITASLAKDVLTQIAGAEGEPVTLNIMSRGGDVVAGNAMIAALRAYPGQITAKVYGLAASMAAALSQVGDERLIAEDALFQVHNGAALPMGRPTKERLQETAQMLEVVDNILIKSFNKSNLTEAALRALLIEDKPLGAAEAVKMGFFDGSIETLKAAAILNSEIMAKDQSILEKLKAITAKFSAPKAVDEPVIVAPGAPAIEPEGEPVVDAPVTRGEFDALMKLVEELIAKMSPIDAPTVEEAVSAQLDKYMTALKSDAVIPVATATGEPEPVVAGAEGELTVEQGGKGYLNARQKEIQSKFKK